MGKLIFSDGMEAIIPSPIELTTESIGVEEPTQSMTIGSTGEITLELNLSINPLSLLKILTGLNISNNWLKMHGGVLQRPRQIKRLKRRKRNE